MTTANGIIGVAHDVHIDQEGKDVILRFVVQSGEGDRVPVEMRGKQVHGVLGEGDRVALIGAKGRDQDGVARPDEVEDQTTSSRISMARVAGSDESEGPITKSMVVQTRPHFLTRVFVFVMSVLVVLTIGVVGTLLAQYLVESELVSLPPSLVTQVVFVAPYLPLFAALNLTQLSLAAMLVGLAAMLLVLVWIFVLRRPRYVTPK